MEMFLMALCMSLLGVAVTAIAFGAATRDETREAEALPAAKPVPASVPARFFVEEMPVPVAARQPRVPIEALLLQIERHIRLEQAAAESFLESPTAQSLHSRTSSPLVH
jgi:hypothetical protein